MVQRVTTSWLLGLLRQPQLLQRFPFLQALSHRYSVVKKGCKVCGQDASIRQYTTQLNEVAKILATISETEIQEFKTLTAIDLLQVTYMDLRGQRVSVVR